MISSRLVASILAGSNDEDIDNRIMPEMAARTLRFRLPQRKNQARSGSFARGSKVNNNFLLSRFCCMVFHNFCAFIFFASLRLCVFAVKIPSLE
jgi:hypothetical protein